MKEIRWKQDNVEVIDSNSKIFSAQKILITVPLGVLQSKPNEEAHNNFSPPILGFLISDTPFTAWWTQLPDKTPLLTGWLAGPNAKKNKNKSDDELIAIALEALSYIFNTNESFFTKNLRAGKVVNWQTDPYSLGAYSYATLESINAKKVLTKPVEETIFFAGEALSEGVAMATLEEALANGTKTAKDMLDCFKN